MLGRISPFCFALLCVIITVPLGCSPKKAANAIPSSALAILENAERLEVFSIDPPMHFAVDPNPSPVCSKFEPFHGYRVLGSVAVVDKNVRVELAALLEKAADDNQGMVAACFNPRHGIRAIQGGQVADFVICFECLSASCCVNDEPAEKFLISSSPQPSFDKLLKDAGVALAEKAH